jgi:hypothetical protein
MFAAASRRVPRRRVPRRRVPPCGGREEEEGGGGGGEKHKGLLLSVFLDSKSESKNKLTKRAHFWGKGGVTDCYWSPEPQQEKSNPFTQLSGFGIPSVACHLHQARMWARRWRKRWGARHGRLGLADDISLAEKQDKALPFYNLDGSGFWFSGPGKRDRFRVQIPRPKMVSPFSKS